MKESKDKKNFAILTIVLGCLIGFTIRYFILSKDVKFIKMDNLTLSIIVILMIILPAIGNIILYLILMRKYLPLFQEAKAIINGNVKIFPIIIDLFRIEGKYQDRTVRISLFWSNVFRQIILVKMRLHKMPAYKLPLWDYPRPTKTTILIKDWVEERFDFDRRIISRNNFLIILKNLRDVCEKIESRFCTDKLSGQ